MCVCVCVRARARIHTCLCPMRDHVMWRRKFEVGQKDHMMKG